MFQPDNPNHIKWIEHRDSEKSGLHKEDILEIDLEWDTKNQEYRFVDQKN